MEGKMIYLLVFAVGFYMGMVALAVLIVAKR
jgi:hypothetical protein